MSIKATWILGAGLALVAASAARADWLVTRDGGRFEIKGAWHVKGKLVVFTLPSGALSSLRLEQVDLDQSRTATEEAKATAAAAAAAPPPAAEPRRKSILSLTDKDFKKIPPPDADKDKDGKDKEKDGKDKGKEGGGAKVATSTSGSLQVVNWERVPPDKTTTEGLELTGTVANSSTQQVTDVQVMANLYDEAGTLVGKVPAQLTNPNLGPGESTAFTVSAPGLFAFSAVRFDTQSRGFKAKTAPAAPPVEAETPAAKPPR